MAFCTKCGQPLAPGLKFCTKCGQKVPEAVTSAAPPVTPPPAPPVTPSVSQVGPQTSRVVPPTPQMAPPPVPQPAMTAPAAKPAVKMPSFITPKAAQVANASVAVNGNAGNIFNIRALSQKGEWVASSWDMSALVKPRPASLTARIKSFFTPKNKLAYAWFLLPVLSIIFTIISYIFHLIGKLFS